MILIVDSFAKLIIPISKISQLYFVFLYCFLKDTVTKWSMKIIASSAYIYT